MRLSNPNEAMPTRRKLLGSLASAGALLGLNGASSQEASAAATPNEPEQTNLEKLFAQARLRNYKTRRSSSWDRTGGNNDAVPVDPGKGATLLDVNGAGIVTHLWFRSEEHT